MLTAIVLGLALAAPSARLPAQVRPTKYVLKLDVDPDRDTFSGEETIALQLDRDTGELRLHGIGLAVTRASWRPAKGKPVALRWEQDGEQLVFRSATPLKAGAASLSLAWTAKLDEKELRGLYRYRHENRWWVGSQFEATDARRMAPCFDEPGFKVPLELTVVAPTGLVVVGNTRPAKTVDDTKTGRSTVTFTPSLPLPTYLWALVIGPYEVVEAGSVGPTPVRILVPRGKVAQAKYAAWAAVNSVRVLEEYFAVPYAYGKLDLLSLGDFSSGAMENAGAVTFREEALLVDEADASVGTRRGVASVIAHELAHQWFGDLVTMAWWDDLWLNEAFATWMAAKVVDRMDPALQAGLNRLAGKRGAMAMDALPSSHPIRTPVESEERALEIFDTITYAKGGSVLGMIESWLGEDVFREGLRRYIRRHAHGNATTGDLFRALEEASGKPVVAVAQEWITRPGHPVVTVDIACGADGVRARMTQARYHAVGEPDGPAPWQVPVCMKYPGDDGVKTACGLLSGVGGELALPSKTCPAWVLPDAGAHGFYVYALSPERFRALARAPLSPGERLDLVGNGWALVKSGVLGVDAYLDVLAGLKEDDNPYVLGAIAGRHDAILDTLVPLADKPALRRATAAQFAAHAARVGWDPRPGEDTAARELRSRILGAMVLVAEDPAYVAEADRRARAWLKAPAGVSMDVAQVAMRSASQRFTSKDLVEVRAALPTAESPERRTLLVGSLSMSLDPVVMREGLALVGSDVLRGQDAVILVAAPLGDQRSAPAGWAWFKENYDAVKARVPEATLSWAPLFTTGFCTAAERDDVVAFFGSHEVDGTETRLKEAQDLITTCIRVREAQQPALRRWLDAAKAPVRKK